MEKGAQDAADLKSSDGSSSTTKMVRRDVLNNRIVVSLWTVQVVTVLFTVVSLLILMLLGTGIALQDTGIAVLGICCLALLIAALLLELRLYTLHVLSIGVYACLQAAKIVNWAVILLILLHCSVGVEDSGTRVLMEASKKLVLPFLASALHSIIVYGQERASMAKDVVNPAVQQFPALEHLETTFPE